MWVAGGSVRAGRRTLRPGRGDHERQITGEEASPGDHPPLDMGDLTTHPPPPASPALAAPTARDVVWAGQRRRPHPGALRPPALVLAALLLLPCASCLSSFTTPGLASSELWEHQAMLDDEGAFWVQWSPRRDHVQFRLTVRTTGYIGFGLSTKPMMDGADIVVGWVHSGKAYLQDRHGRGNIEPRVDEQRDWLLVGGYENQTHTVLIMSRPYDTCDPHDYVISNDTVRLLWAYHPDDPVDPDSPRPRLHYHGGDRRGAKTLFLLGRGHHPRSSRPHHHHHHRRQHLHTEASARSWLLTNPGVEVDAASDTLYWCKVFRRPHLLQKNHIIRYEPVFEQGNEQYVHHMIVYECTDPVEGMEDPFEEMAESGGHACYQHDRLVDVANCNHVVVAWAVGSQGLTLPPEAGYPLTPAGPRYYMMETHYDNPNGHAFSDNSGIRIIYTSELRFNDAGVLSVGLYPNWKHLIPPQQKTVVSEGHCVSECTRAAFPDSGIRVFAVVLHTHLLGRRFRVRHLRGGRELEPLARDDNYDYNYQEYRTLHTPRVVLPGDHLIGECTYDSQQKTTITLGGFKTRDEMCLSYLFYWPRAEISLCHSTPSLDTVLHSLGIQELAANSNPIKIRRPIDLAGKTLEWRLVHYDWKNHFEYYQETVHKGSYNPMCWQRGSSLVSELNEADYAYPNVTELWAPENVCRRRRRKNRRRKTKAGHGRNHHLLPHMPEDEEEEVDEGEDVMFDDQTNSKPIEIIDVDPPYHRDFIMPVVEEKVEGNNLDRFGGDHLGTRGTLDPELEDELQEMERDLEQELAGRDGSQETTAHRNTVGTSRSSQTEPVFVWTFVVTCTALWWHSSV